MSRHTLYKVGQYLVNHLSLAQSYAFAKLINYVQYMFCVKDRNSVRRNLSVILNSPNVPNKLVREVFYNFGRYLVEFFRMEKFMDDAFIAENIHIKGEEHLDAVLKQGHGGILISAHLGNWEMGAAVVSMRGFPITVVALTHACEQVNALFNHQRQVKGVEVVQTAKAVRTGYEAFENNRLFAIVADREFGKKGVEVEFLGKRCLMPKGAAMFSIKAGAPLIPIFLVREPDNKFQLKISDPIYPPSNVNENNMEDEVKKLIRQYLVVIENMIHQYPEQWLVFPKFWIDSPEGTAAEPSKQHEKNCVGDQVA